MQTQVVEWAPIESDDDATIDGSSIVRVTLYRVNDDNEKYELSVGRNVITRSPPDNTVVGTSYIVINSKNISREHALIEVGSDDDPVWLQDLGSSNGTFIITGDASNSDPSKPTGTRLEPQRTYQLHHSNVVSFGDQRFTIHILKGSSLPQIDQFDATVPFDAGRAGGPDMDATQPFDAGNANNGGFKGGGVGPDLDATQAFGLDGGDDDEYAYASPEAPPSKSPEFEATLVLGGARSEVYDPTQVLDVSADVVLSGDETDPAPMRDDEDTSRKRKAEEEARQKAEEEARTKAEEEARQARADEEARVKAEEEARQKAEEEARAKAEEEARAKAEARVKAEEEARAKAEEEARQARADEEARVRAEEEARQARADEEARVKAEEDARQKAEEEARAKAEEEARQKVEEEERQKAEARQKAEEARKEEDAELSGDETDPNMVQSTNGGEASKRMKRVNEEESKDEPPHKRLRKDETPVAEEQSVKHNQPSDDGIASDTLSPPTKRQRTGDKRSMEDKPVLKRGRNGAAKSKPRTTRKRRRVSSDDGEDDATRDGVNTRRRSGRRKQFVIKSVGFVLPEEWKPCIKRLGGETTDNPSECTHVVVDTSVGLKRSSGCLGGMCVCEYVVTDEWLRKSMDTGHFVSESNYWVVDKGKEAKYKFSLKESVQRNKRHNEAKSGFLVGRRVYITKNALPNRKAFDEVQVIVKCADGEVVKRQPRRFYDDIIVIGCEEDDTAVQRLTKLGYVIHEREALFTSALRQELCLKEFEMTT